MIDPIQLDAQVRAFAVGGFSVLGVSMALAQRRLIVRAIGTFFFVTAIGHTLDNCTILQGPDGHGGPLVHVLSVMASGMFWLFALMLFEDEREMPIWRVWPPLLLTAAALLAMISPAPLTRVLWLIYNLGTVSLVVHALAAIWRGWKGDLVYPRRRLRAPIMAAAATYVLFTAARDMGGTLGLQEGAPPLIQGIMLAVLALAGSVVLLRVDGILIGPTIQIPADQPTSMPLDLIDQGILAKLSKAMEEEIWRREELSIRSLADHVVTTEHRLRRLINGELGHRNFAAFVNAARIEAAKRDLRDPNQALRSVAVIAYDLGFGSLGPFNRAFREIVGVTPTAWRQGQGLAETS